MAAASFDKFYVWEGGVAGSAANKRKVSRAATGTGPTVVKLKSKKDGTVVSQMDVWVVWADGVPTPPTAALQAIPGGQVYAAVAGDRWRFVFTIQPSLIITGIASGDDVPDLRGDNKSKPPGSKKDYLKPSLGKGDTATAKWDLSRNLSVTVRNPRGILKGDLQAAVPIDALWQGQREATTDPIVSVTEPIMFPAGDAEGNDDPIVNPVDEHDVPYNQYSGDGLDHAIGQISSADTPMFTAVDSWCSAVDQTFAMEADFLEFARLELINDPLKIRAGQTWFRISDFKPWHHALKVKSAVLTLTPPTLGWGNNGSESTNGNINH